MTGTQITFLSRLASTVALWTVALWIIFTGHPAGFFALIATMGLLGLWEFFAMLDHKGLPNFKLTAMVCGLAFLSGSFYCLQRFGVAKSYDFELAVSVVLLLILFSRQLFERTREHSPLEATALTLFGLLYIVGLFNFVTKIVFLLPGTGHFYVLFLLVLTKFSDMGAYLTGLAFGKHLMVPHISPKKTWEGFAGALLFPVLGAHAMLWLLPEKLGVLKPTHATVLGLLLGFAAVIGDLAESLIKRSCDAKDSGKMLPGIGGVLDLIDSLLFTAPLLFVYLRLVVRVP